MSLQIWMPITNTMVLRLLLTPVMQDWPCWVIVDGLAAGGGVCLGSTRKLHVGVVFKTETKMKFR